MTYFNAPYRPADLTLNSDAINSSLVGFWPLTDGSGTTAKDISGVGSNLTSPSTPLWGSSSIGPAYTSNGIDHQAYLNTNNGFPISSVNAFSVSFWYESDASGSYGDFLGDWSGGSEKNLLIRNNLECYVRNAGDTAEDGIQAVFPSGSPFDVAGAYHIVLVIDSGNAKLFINGSLNNQDTSFMAGPYIAGNDNLKIGRGFNQSMQSGFLNNVRIFNAALTAAQVKQLYTRPWTGTNYDTEALWLSPPASPTLSTASEATALMTSCVGWWPLTEGDNFASGAADISGNSNNGTPQANAGSSNTALGQVLEQPDANSYISVGDVSALKITGALSISIWLKTDSSTPVNIVSKYHATSGGRAYSLHLNRPELEFNINGTTVAQGTTQIRGDDKWHHLVGVYDPSNFMRVYVDGALDGELTTGVPSSITDTSYPFNIGRAYNSGNVVGFLQNCRVFASALTADQVRLLYERPWIGAEYNESFYLYPPVPSSLTPLDSSSINTDQELWLPLTDGTGTTAVDISGGSNDGTLDTTVSFGNGELGTNAEFDPAGLNDGITTTYSPNGLSAISLSAWVRNDGGSAGSGFAKILASDHSAGSGGFDWMIGKSSNASYALYIAGVGNVSIASTTLPALGEWWHAAATWETGGNIKLYINGVEVTYSRLDSYTGSLTTTNNVEIGDAPDNTRPWNGGIQNVRLWSRALSATEVADIYYSPWLGSAYTGTSSDPATNRYFSPAAFARLG